MMGRNVKGLWDKRALIGLFVLILVFSVACNTFAGDDEFDNVFNDYSAYDEIDNSFNVIADYDEFDVNFFEVVDGAGLMFSLDDPGDQADSGDSGNQGDSRDQGTFVSSKWAGLETEGMASWFRHCAKWYSKTNRTSDLKDYAFEFDFSSSWLQRGSAKVYISDLRIDSCEVWEPISSNDVMLQWYCNVDSWPSEKSKCNIYVKPRLAIYNKKTGKVSRYEESGNGVESIRTKGNHYVRLNKNEYVGSISTGPKDALYKFIDKNNDEAHSDYFAVIEQITVTVVLKNV